MKTKIGAAVIALFFLMACGSNQPKQEEQQPVSEVAPPRYVIKALSNMMYLALGPDSVIIANQPDPTKAEAFEKIDLGNGKSALKTSFGKYVCADQYRASVLVANRDKVGGWETFEITSIDPVKIIIKSSEGKYVCANSDNGGILVADRPEAHSWETFALEPK